MKRILPVILVLMLFLTVSCVGQKQNNRVYKVDETAKAAISMFGNEADAAYAILKAADNGYSTRQIVEAIHDKSLDESGNIEGSSPSQTGEGAISSGTEDDDIKLAAGSLSGLLLAGDNGAAKSNNSTYRLLDELTSKSAQTWIPWTLQVMGEGYSTGQIEKMMKQLKKLHKIGEEYDSRFKDEPPIKDRGGSFVDINIPPMVSHDGKKMAVVMDYDNWSIVKPEHADGGWPFEEEDTVKDFLSDLGKDTGKFINSLNIGRKGGTTAGQSAGETFDIELRLDPDYKGEKAISSYRMTINVPEDGKISGNFTIKIKEPENMRTIKGTFYDSHGTSVIYPVTFEIYGINADYKQSMEWDDGRTSSFSDREDGALRGKITNKHYGSGKFNINGLYFTWVL